MSGLLSLGAFLLFGMMLVGLIGGILKLVFWVIFLPFRLLGSLVALPFMAAGAFFKVLFGVMFLPLLLVGGMVVLVFGVLAAVVSLLVPLMPLLIVGVVVWGLVKAFSRPAVMPQA
jgi:hypothetical protein